MVIWFEGFADLINLIKGTKPVPPPIKRIFPFLISKELSEKSKVNIEIEQSTLITVESVEKIIAQKKV